MLGAGLAGLSASLAFARSGRRVLLLERDGPGVAGDADRLFECWDRPGIAHFRQPHNFLALGRQVLLDRAPDVLDHVLALGARKNRQYELLPAEAREGDERFVSAWTRPSPSQPMDPHRPSPALVLQAHAAPPDELDPADPQRSLRHQTHSPR